VLDLVSFERDLDALTTALNTPEAFGLEGEAGQAARALLANGQQESPRVRWQLLHGDLLQALSVEPLRADIVFWDPFSPKTNPDLWTVARSPPSAAWPVLAARSSPTARPPPCDWRCCSRAGPCAWATPSAKRRSRPLLPSRSVSWPGRSIGRG